MSGHKPQHGKNNPPPKPRQDGDEKSSNRHVYVEPGVQIDFVQDLKEKYDSAQGESKTQYEKQLFWTKVAAGLLLLTAGFAGWQGCLTRNIIIDTNKHFSQDQRPYVVVKNPGFINPTEFAPKHPLHAQVTVTNVGRTPSVSMYDIVALLYFPPPKLGPPDEYAVQSQQRFIDAAFDNLGKNEQNGRTILMPLSGEDDIAPGGDYFSVNPGLPTLTQPEFDDVRSDNPIGGALFLVGLITYTDTLDAAKHPRRMENYPYRTEFCWYLTGPDQTIWRRCRFHNIIR